MKETELAQKFIDFFDDKYEIFKEVPAEGIIDFVAKFNNITIAVEVKLSLNFDVIEQAKKNKFYCTYSYIAVPEPKHKHFGYEICEMLGIGVLVYKSGNFNEIKEYIKPNVNRHLYNKFYRLNLEPYMKLSKAGAATDRITPYKITIDRMVNYIRRHPNCKLKDCLNNIDFHWSNITSAKGCIYAWLNKGIIKEFYIENSVLYLTEYGKTKDLIDYY